MGRPLHLVWLSAVAAALAFAWMGSIVDPLRPTIPDLQLAWTRESFQAVLTAWGDPGLAIFRAHLPADFVFLASYGAFGYLLARHTTVFLPLEPFLGRSGRWLLPAAALFDALENLSQLWLVSSSGLPWPLFEFAVAMVMVKWLLAAAFFLALGLALIVRGWRPS